MLAHAGHVIVILDFRANKCNNTVVVSDCNAAGVQLQQLRQTPAAQIAGKPQLIITAA